MRTKKRRQDNINNDQHDEKKGRKATRELSDDFDFMEEWYDEELSDITGYNRNDFD